MNTYAKVRKSVRNIAELLKRVLHEVCYSESTVISDEKSPKNGDHSTSHGGYHTLKARTTQEVGDSYTDVENLSRTWWSSDYRNAKDKVNCEYAERRRNELKE